MKKSVQIAFAITLVILSILATCINAELLSNIVLGIVIPSFLLTIISFIEAIISKCKTNAVDFAKTYRECADLHFKLTKELLEKPQSKENAQKIEEEQNEAEQKLHECFDYIAMAEAMNKLLSFLKYANLIAYILLFLSMILSPYIVRILAKINLNCITLWSLTILYVDIELKTEMTAKMFTLFFKHYSKKSSKQKE